MSRLFLMNFRTLDRTSFRWENLPADSDRFFQNYRARDIIVADGSPNSAGLGIRLDNQGPLDRLLAGRGNPVYSYIIYRNLGDLYLTKERFVDAADWVMVPNVMGMGLWADGGRMATKPYVSGGAYINRMSDYCSDCTYNPQNRVGEDACPFTTLYWHFLDRNRDRLAEKMVELVGEKEGDDEGDQPVRHLKTMLIGNKRDAP